MNVETPVAVSVYSNSAPDVVPYQVGLSAHNITFVIDESGSMGIECRDGKKGELRYKRIELAIHCIKLAVHCLDENTSIEIIGFESNARVILPMTVMNAGGKHVALETVRNLQERGGTYMCNGIELALRELEMYRNEAEREPRQYDIVFLTDGEDSRYNGINLIRNFLAISEKYAVKPHISFVGFSDAVRSQDLYDLALMYNSMFYYIADASMIVTVFMNVLVNIMHPMVLEQFRERANEIADLIISSYTAGQKTARFLQVAKMLVSSHDPFDQALYQYINPSFNPNLGQIDKAFDPEYVRTWCAHHLLSYVSSLKNLSLCEFIEEFITIQLQRHWT